MDINRVRLGCRRGFPGNFKGVTIDGIFFFFNYILLDLFIIFLSLLMELTDLCYLREKSFSLAQFVFDHAFPKPQLFMSFSHCFLCLTGFLQL